MIQNISLHPHIDPNLFSSIRQNTNNLSESDTTLRKRSIKELYNFIITQQLTSSSFQQITQQFFKPLLTAFADKSEEVREYSIKIVIQLLIRCQEVDFIIPYLTTVLVDRLNCQDLEGIKNVPEAMRPPPGQKPKVILKLVQTSQEVRLNICKLVEKIIGLVDVGIMRKHIDDMVNIVRSLVMDPSGDIQLSGCNILSVFCSTYENILLHYTQTMGRAVLLPLISKKSKIRIAALNALNKVLLCGVWKYNAFVFQNLIGFKDPNSVAIKQFYEPTFNVNYLASLIVDPNVKVRETFMKCLQFWICVLNDKYDHHPKLVPYILSGLFDEEETIKNIAFETLEEIGKQIELQKQAEFKDFKQYGMDSAWTWEGKLKNLPLPSPFKTRPGQGSRFFVKGHIRKLWPALFREIRDINIQHRKKAVNLALMGVVYTQQSMSSHLDKFIPNFITSLRISNSEDAAICQKVGQLFFYLGRYCPYSSYIHIIKSGISGELVQNQQFIQSTFKALSKLMQGSIQAIPTDTGLCHKKKDISDLLNLINEVQLYDSIDQKNCKQVEELVIILVDGIGSKGTEQDKNQLFGAHFVDLFKLLMISLYEQELSGLSSPNVKQVRGLTINSQLGRSLQLMNKLLKEYGFQVKEQLELMFTNPPNFSDSNFKFLIGVYVYTLIYNQNTQLTELVVQIIKETITFNRIADLIDFIFKLQRSVALSGFFNQNILNYVISIISQGELNLSHFKSYKKAPSYEQQKQHSIDELIITEQAAQNIFDHLTSALQAILSSKISLTDKESMLSGLIYGFIKVVKAFKVIKPLATNSVRPLWALLERTNYILSVQKLIHDKEYVLPLIIDYLIERLQTIESGTQMYYLTIATLSRIFDLFPKSQTAMVKIPMHYLDYSGLLSKLFKYCLNQKDIESKQKLKKMLGVLFCKTKDWFQIQYKEAVNKGMHQRVKLIEEIMN